MHVCQSADFLKFRSVIFLNNRHNLWQFSKIFNEKVAYFLATFAEYIYLQNAVTVSEKANQSIRISKMFWK